MAGPGGKEVGRLNLKVLPDTTQFGTSLRRYVARIEKQVVVRLNVEISDKAVTRELTQLQARLDVQRPDVKVDVDLAAKEVRAAMLALLIELRAMARAMRPTIRPNVSQVAVATSAIGNMTNALGSSAAGSSHVGRQIALWGPLIFAAAVGIAAIGPALAALLPLVAGIGAGIGAIALGFEQLKPLAAPIREAFAGMRKEIGTVLSAGLMPLVRTFANDFLPILKDGLVDIAGLLNDATKDLLGFLNSSTGLSVMSDFMDALTTAMRPLTGLLGPLTEVFLRLSTQAAPALEMMNTAIVNVTESLAGWLASTDISGVITESMADLGQILVEVGQLIRDLFVPLFAAAPAVIAMLDGIGEVLGAVFLALTPVFEFMSENTTVVKLLAGAFAGIAIAVAAVMAVAAVVGLVFASTATLIGAAVGAIAGAIIVAYNQFEGFRNVVHAVVDAVVAAFFWLRDAFSDALSAIAGSELWAAIVDAAQSLWSYLVAVWDAIVAVVTSAMDALNLGGGGGGFWSTLWSTTQAVFSFLVPFIQAHITTVVAVLTGAFRIMSGIFSALAAVVRTLTPVFAFVVTYVGAHIRTMIGAFRLAWSVASTVFGAVAKVIRASIAAAVASFNVARSAVSRVFSFIASYIRAQIAVGMAALRAVGGVITSVIGFFRRLQSGISAAVAAAITIVRGIPGRIRSALGGLGSLLVNAGRQIIQGLIDGINGMIDKVRSKLGELTSLIPDWKGPMSRDRVLLKPTGEAIIDGLISGFDSRENAVRGRLGDFTDLIAASIDAAFDVPDLRLGVQVDSALDDYTNLAANLNAMLGIDDLFGPEALEVVFADWAAGKAMLRETSDTRFAQQAAANTRDDRIGAPR